MKALICTFLLVALLPVIPAVAQHGEDTLQNPYTKEEDVKSGSLMYRSHCAVCHGLKGEGSRGRELLTGLFRHGSRDMDIYKTISEGIPGTEMPGIFFEGRQLWQLVAFVKSLSVGRAAEQVDGDATKGREVYMAKGCMNCHRVQGDGNRLGPDLSDVGAKRSLGHLQSSVLKPNEKVLPQHWMVRAITKDGMQVSGLRMNEDTFSVQLINAREELMSFQKSDLSQYDINRSSSMPSFEGQFEGSDFNDLIAYLASLRLER